MTRTVVLSMAGTEASSPVRRVAIDLPTARAQFYVRADGPTPLIEVAGELDLSNADALAGCLSVFESGDAIIVDLTRLEFIDSRGIAALVMPCNQNVNVVVRGAQGQVRQVLDLARLNTILTIEDSPL